MYVASLASSPRAISDLMEPVRHITARLRPTESLNLEDVQRLAKVYSGLETYLVNDEPLRAYTKEAIHKKLHGKFQVGGSVAEYWARVAQAAAAPIQKRPLSATVIEHAKRFRSLGRQIMGWAAIIGIICIVLPARSCGHAAPLCNNVDMTLSVWSDLLLFGGAALFLMGLGGFRTRFKIIYRLLCAGMVLFALAQSQQVIYTQLGLWDVPFIAHGGVAAGFAPGVFLFYASMYLFARLLKVKTVATSFWAMLVTTGTLIAILMVVPHFPSPLPPDVLKAALPPSLLLDTLLAYAAMMVLSIKKVAAPAYTPALAWLFLGLATIAFATFVYTCVQIFFPSTDNIFLSYGGISAILVIAGVLLVRSGVVFNQITEG